jgi:hypothetical protein
MGMAAEPRPGERVYQEIKQAILSGDLRQRERLDIDELAARYRVSATPVRHALAVLGAERLVTVHPSRGYHVSFWTEAELSALYEWRWQLAKLALKSFKPQKPARNGAGPYADAVVAILKRLGAGANVEIRRASEGADERLRAAYRVEPDALANTDRELAALAEAMDAGDAKRILQRLKAFFSRRIAECGAIRARAGVTALPRNGDG